MYSFDFAKSPSADDNKPFRDAVLDDLPVGPSCTAEQLAAAFDLVADSKSRYSKRQDRVGKTEYVFQYIYLHIRVTILNRHILSLS